MLILLVCTGNTCRSSMAEHLLRVMLKDSALNTQIAVDSAGLAAVPNQPAAKHAIEVAKEYGCDLSSHRSKQLTASLLRKADLVLTMTRNHSQLIKWKYPQFSSKVFAIKEFISAAGDIGDPYGQSLAQYQKTARELYEVLQRVVEKLQFNNDIK